MSLFVLDRWVVEAAGLEDVAAVVAAVVAAAAAVAAAASSSSRCSTLNYETEADDSEFET